MSTGWRREPVTGEVEVKDMYAVRAKCGEAETLNRVREGAGISCNEPTDCHKADWCPRSSSVCRLVPMGSREMLLLVWLRIMPLAVLWHKEGPLREASGGEGVVLKSVPVEFAYFVACLCVASFFFFFLWLYGFGSDYLGEAENKALATLNSCCNFCTVPELDLFFCAF